MRVIWEGQVQGSGFRASKVAGYVVVEAYVPMHGLNPARWIPATSEEARAVLEAIVLDLDKRVRRARKTLRLIS